MMCVNLVHLSRWLWWLRGCVANTCRAGWKVVDPSEVRAFGEYRIANSKSFLLVVHNNERTNEINQSLSKSIVYSHKSETLVIIIQLFTHTNTSTHTQIGMI